MPTDLTTDVRARLELGFRTDNAHLLELEGDIIRKLDEVRAFSETHEAPAVWREKWLQHWSPVEALLRKMRRLVTTMHDCIGCSDSESLKTALAAWDEIQAENTALVETLTAIRAETAGIHESVRTSWDALSASLDPQLETIYACAQSLRIKLELLKAHTKEETEALIQSILAKPQAPAVQAPEDTVAFDNAAIELGKEQHEYLGVWDMIKSLWMWIETPSERLAKMPAAPHIT